ncbi:hypothetical protein C1H46_039832 [Malus baccata]|uniref:FPL domain-containing protein n=1 Tax=Malus baccata TaxID=106549 RepID=A0A540KKB6_MALBA|nr:hypothetical protein C1H46_039832 [Malus baccata]
MWRSLWRSIDRFSLQYFKYVINELRKIKVVDGHNRELVIDLLQSIVELVTYGDRQDPSIFEYELLFMDAVVSFPLYEEALKFAHHGDKMIQTAICALTLSIYNASDDMVYQYITTPPVSRYFSDMVSSLSKKFFHLDALVHDAEMRTRQKKEEILLETDKIVDDLYYLKDILGIGESRLSRAVTENLLRILIVPILLPLLQMGQSNILNALLKVLASQPPYSILIQWHTGWFLRKLLICQGKGLSDHNFQLFNTSYQQSRECLQKELDGCWFDHIPEAFRNEWANCKAALQEASQCKDPFFVLELDVSQQTTDGDATSYCAWQRMVDNVKVFILHLQLKSTISKGELLEEPLLDSSAIADSSNTHASNGASASFGSEVALGSGISCRISFSKAGIRDIYLIPVAKKTSGKVILAEKHPFRSQRGIVLAIAPLAGLIPKIDEDHPTWLHLQIREFEPKLYKSKVRGHLSGKSNHVADGRWTLGFPNAKACEAARLSILEETRKQRSSVESVLAPLLQNSCLGKLSESEDE